MDTQLESDLYGGFKSLQEYEDTIIKTNKLNQQDRNTVLRRQEEELTALKLKHASELTEFDSTHPGAIENERIMIALKARDFFRKAIDWLDQEKFTGFKISKLEALLYVAQLPDSREFTAEGLSEEEIRKIADEVAIEKGLTQQRAMAIIERNRLDVNTYDRHPNNRRI